MLELFGFQGIKNLNQYYKNRNKENYKNLKLIKKKNKSAGSGFCPITLGVSFLDQIRTLEKFKKCTFQKVAYPILFLPFLSKGSEIVGKRIVFKFDKSELLLNFNINILSNISKKKFPLLVKNLEVSFLENKDTFTESEWKNLYKIAENTFVEETESLKQGAAGAGLTDND